MQQRDLASDIVLAALLLVAAVVLLGGCQQPQVAEEEPAAPVFFPPPPDMPRLQFLRAFSGPEDVGVAGPSAFETFIVGEQTIEEKIAKPYGVALHGRKLYVCDMGHMTVNVLDLEKRTFGYLTKDRRLRSPVNIFIDDQGVKYITDPPSGAVFVFDAADTLRGIIGTDIDMSPLDVYVRDGRCYVTDLKHHQVVVFDAATGEEINRFGQQGQGPGEFQLISDLTLDAAGSIYVSDRVKGEVIKFSNDGIYQQTFGGLGQGIHQLIRPKGVAIDRDGNLWVVDTATEVVKIYNAEGRILMFFGLPGNEPGRMNMPADVSLNHGSVDLFREYAVEGADLRFLVLVSNQFGLGKINVYGFGSFPRQMNPQPAADGGATTRQE